MALTAARTELNVSLVGEDETIRMIEDAKKRMGELEAKTRSLTGATQAQTQAARAQTEATGGLNSTLGRMGSAISGPLEGIGKLKEAIGKGIEIFGFLGSAVSGAIDAYEFLDNAFNNTAEKAEKHKKELEAAKSETDRLKGSTDALRGAIAALAVQLGTGAAAIANQRARIAGLRGDVEGAAFETREALIAGEETKLAEMVSKVSENNAQLAPLQQTVADATRKATEATQKAATEVKRLQGELNKLTASNAGEAVKIVEARKQLTQQIETAKALQQQAGAAYRAEAADASDKLKLIEAQNKQFGVQIGLQKEIVELEIEGHAKDMLAKPTSPGDGGGGGGGKKQPVENQKELARQEMLLLRAEADEIARVVKALYEEQQAREANEAAMLSATKLMRDEVGTTLPALRQQMMRDLAALPGGELFESIRKQLQEQVKAVDAQMGDLRALANVEDADLLAQATDKQVQALDKLQESYLNLGEAKAKALEESIKLREELERGEIAGSVNQFSEALQQLGQMQAPVFEVVTESLAGINAQMGKFKEGQQSLTTAIVGSAGAIAGAVGKKIDNVKLEAGIRALFETAMGFATLGNPAESVGHFTAAAMFGLVAGGVIPTTAKSGKDGGGSKAPAKTEAKSRDSMMGGGGGQVTNVYNLQTGIVDGQSTAQAFRRAEMQARNTGMASAGGW